MLNDPRAATTSREDQDHDHDVQIRDIHALSPPHPSPPPTTNRLRRRETWETSSHISSSLSMASEGASSENFTSMSREFNALVLAGSSMGDNNGIDNENGNNNLVRIGEEGDVLEETNPLAIVPDNNPLPSPRRDTTGGGAVAGSDSNHSEVSVLRVKREEVKTKISAWQTAKVAKINNRFKREDVIISGWESEQVQKATSWMKKVERKLEEKRARALEKMQNEVAKAHRKAEEKRASAEAKRGTKVARVLEIANLMKAVGRAPSKRSFF
ncbi:remorin 4.1-like [Actinidia eriantha]|uniref:remorin 4.1-like n=1 Tax=Actinidia eriantha TaxID=165200 RepID=UPI00258E7483|nr:remorin 4.1-like [Actinidia eriantha]